MTENKSGNMENNQGKMVAIPDFVYHLCRIALGLLFIVASFDKIARPWDFGRAVYVYELLEGPLAYLISPVAIIMPPLELVCGLFLVFNRHVRPAAYLILAMNLVFIFAISSAIVRGMDIDCGCGLDVGALAVITGTQADINALIRDFVILAMNIVVIIAPQSRHRRGK